MAIDLDSLIDDETRRLAREDPRQIIESFFYIIDKKGQRVPFVFNEAQIEYYNNRSARDDILKARKEGFSSMVLAMWTVYFLFLDNVSCVCISHEQESTQRLFEKVAFFIDNMEYNGEKIEVKIHDRSRKRLRRHNSTFYVGTAGSKAFGRGDTINFLHMSEVAFWENAAVLMTGLMNAVPDDLDTTAIVKESTANGYGTQHHKEWVAETSGESVYRPHFFGWHKDPMNQMDLKRFRLVLGHDFKSNTEEDIIASKFGLSDEQLAWRRWKIASMTPDDGHTKMDMFMQEFPIEPREAFLSSGRPVFDLATIEWYEEVYVKPPIRVGDLIGWHPPILVESQTGRLKIWEEPRYNATYVIAADVAETGDYSYATVIDRARYEQVAEWHGHIEEFEFAAILARLGWYYNTALLGVERNNHGVAVVKKLDELNYPNQYIRQSIDDMTHKSYSELGWRTDSRTRPIMLADLNQAVTNRQFIFHSELFASELRTFARVKNRSEALPGCHDDTVIGNAIGIQLYKFLPDTGRDVGIMVRDYIPNNSIYNSTR